MRSRALRCVHAIVAAAALMASTALADDEYPTVEREGDDGAPPPAGYHRETRLREDVLIGGLTSLGISYASIAFSSTALVSRCSGQPVQGSYTCGFSPDAAQALLFIPVAGPFIGLTYGNTTLTQIFLVLDGVSQAVGLGMILSSLLFRKSVLVRDDGVGHTTYLGPISLGTGAGLGLLETW